MDQIITSASIAAALGVTRQRINILVKTGRITPTGKVGNTYVFGPDWRNQYERTRPKMGRPSKQRQTPS